MHNNWGVGDIHCDNGILFFISINDRVAYISTGHGVVNRLTDDDCTYIIDGIKGYLRN